MTDDLPLDKLTEKETSPNMYESGPDFISSPAKPNVARIYDYLLDGKDNYAVDREAADALLKILPTHGLCAARIDCSCNEL